MQDGPDAVHAVALQGRSGDNTINTSRQYFGTDGIRGRVGAAPITPDFIMRLGWAVGRVAQQTATGPVLIGKDTRISGYMLESALEAGLSAAGVDVRLSGPLPTPAIAYLTKNTRASAGIVISASHNPYYDNGIKIFSANGRKLPDAEERRIEQELAGPVTVVDARRLGKARRISDAPRRYIEFCKSKADGDLADLSLIVDCANGAGYKVAPRVFAELGARVDAMAAAPDGFNINADCGATAPARLQAAVRECHADVGIALDGDGDRLILVDHNGEIVDGDQCLYILAQHLHGELTGVVGTQMSNLGLELAIKEMGLDFFRARVGDRYVMDMLQQRQLSLGGEGSGHIINLAVSETGDGILSALQVLMIMVKTGRSLAELAAGMRKFPQRLHNLRLHQAFDGTDTEIVKAVREAELSLGDSGRVLLRPSGTEPALRIMVEGDDARLVDRLIMQLSGRVEAIITR